MEVLHPRPAGPASAAPRFIAATGWLHRAAQWWRCAWRTEEEKFLLGATGLEELERRLKALERGGPAVTSGAGLPWFG